jgi:hypothetical protein
MLSIIHLGVLDNLLEDRRLRAGGSKGAEDDLVVGAGLAGVHRVLVVVAVAVGSGALGAERLRAARGDGARAVRVLAAVPWTPRQEVGRLAKPVQVGDGAHDRSAVKTRRSGSRRDLRRRDLHRQVVRLLHN